jgi:hypothetical protein
MATPVKERDLKPSFLLALAVDIDPEVEEALGAAGQLRRIGLKGPESPHYRLKLGISDIPVPVFKVDPPGNCSIL